MQKAWNPSFLQWSDDHDEAALIAKKRSIYLLIDIDR